MNYKLAKQLKDAGFESKDSALVSYSESDKDGYVIPHLSELIEACGDRFISVRRNVFKDTWYATALPEKFFGRVPQAKDCKTPEEAVAKLWLKLNKTTSVKWT